MEKVKFTDVFEDVTKQGRKISTDGYKREGKYPIIDQGQNEIAGYTNEEYGLFNNVPAIIFGDHTRIIKFVNAPFFLGADGVKVLKHIISNVDYKYSYYALLNVKIPDTGYNRHFKWLKESEIPLPSLEEQKAIAERLDKVSGLIEKRKMQLEKLDLLIKSRFLEMFGDPIDNPYDWTLKPLLSLGECKNGMNFHNDEQGVDIHCLGVGDFKNLSIIDDVTQLPIVSLNCIPSSEYLLKDGDIVFVRSNGNKALVGRSIAIYPKGTNTTFSGFCIRFRKKSEEINTYYLLQVFKTDSTRSKMVGRGANIQNLNQQILASLNIPIPPIELQNDYEAFVKLIDKSKFEIQKSLEKFEILKKSLMQKYFG